MMTFSSTGVRGRHPPAPGLLCFGIEFPDTIETPDEAETESVRQEVDYEIIGLNISSTQTVNDSEVDLGMLYKSMNAESEKSVSVVLTMRYEGMMPGSIIACNKNTAEALVNRMRCARWANEADFAQKKRRAGGKGSRLAAALRREYQWRNSQRSLSPSNV